MPLLGFPIGIRNSDSVRVGAAEPFSAFETIEPSLERRATISAIITRYCVPEQEYNPDGRDERSLQRIQSAHARHRRPDSPARNYKSPTHFKVPTGDPAVQYCFSIHRTQIHSAP